MVYLKYHEETKQVVQISENELQSENGYNVAKSDDFKVGNEFEMTIHINEVDENNFITSYSAIRNNPIAKRLLQENAEFKNKNQELENALLEMSTLSAIQQQQNEQAIMELTMMIGGGM